MQNQVGTLILRNSDGKASFPVIWRLDQWKDTG